MKKTILLTLLMISLSVFARSGGGSTVGNGGDYVASQFLLQSFSVIEILKNNPQLKLPIDAVELQKMIVDRELMVVTVDEELFDKFGKPVDALNFPEGKSRTTSPLVAIENEEIPLIVLNKDSWISYFKNNNFLLPLITHELLGVMGVDDDNYVHSKKILKYGACQENEDGTLKCSNYYPLIEAVKLGDINRAKFLIENGIELNAEDSNGFTAADYALKNRDIELLVYLHHADAQVSAHLNRGYQKSLIVFALKFLNYSCDEEELQIESSNECSFVKTLLEILLQEKTSTKVLNDAIYASVGEVTLDYIIPLVSAGAEIYEPSRFSSSVNSLEWSVPHSLFDLDCMYELEESRSCIDQVFSIFTHILPKRSFDFNGYIHGAGRTLITRTSPLYHSAFIKLFLDYGANPNEFTDSVRISATEWISLLRGSLFTAAAKLHMVDVLSVIKGAQNFQLEHSPQPLIEIIQGMLNPISSIKRMGTSAYDAMKFMLQLYKTKNISVNLRDHFGDTVLDYAELYIKDHLDKNTKEELKRIIKLLKDNGACRTKGFFNRCID